MGPKKVLIVDGDPNSVVTLEYLMQKQGYQVVTAQDGEEGLLQADSFHPDLVLLDAVMPKKTGYEVCQALRAEPHKSCTKILMLSARSRDSDIAKGLALGANVYMTKPFSTKDLTAQVHTLLSA